MAPDRCALMGEWRLRRQAHVSAVRSVLTVGHHDLAGVPEALVRGVVGGRVWAPGLRDEPAEPGPDRQAQRLEPGRHRAGRRPHERVAALGVEQGQVPILCERVWPSQARLEPERALDRPLPPGPLDQRLASSTSCLKTALLM